MAVQENTKQYQNVYVEITEQPAAKTIRFRYECEGRLAGSIPGVNSTLENRTFPSIRIVNYVGPALVVVSCVTKDAPHKPHPHRLVGKEGCRKGVCTLTINNSSMSASFGNLGIQCVKKKEIDAALQLREEIRVDPFRTGFSHRSQPASIDLSVVRLCFQVYLTENKDHHFRLKPVVSDPIYDKKGNNDLNICKLSDCSASVTGGREIILLCEKIAKDDIRVKFFELNHEGALVWEDYGEFNQSNVHKQVAISFKVPKYYNQNIFQPQNVYVQLMRPSDKNCSDPVPFEYLPKETDPVAYKRKRQETGSNPSSHIHYYHQRNLKTPRLEENFNIQKNYLQNIQQNNERAIKMERKSPNSIIMSQQISNRETTNISSNMQPNTSAPADNYINIIDLTGNVMPNLIMNNYIDSTTTNIPTLREYSQNLQVNNLLPNANMLGPSLPNYQWHVSGPNSGYIRTPQNQLFYNNEYSINNSANRELGSSALPLINPQENLVFSDNFLQNNMSMYLDSNELVNLLDCQTTTSNNMPVLDEELIANSFTRLTTNTFLTKNG